MKVNKNPRNLEETRNKKIHQSISEKCQSDYLSQDIHKRTRKGFLSSLPGLFVRSRHPGRQFSVVDLQIWVSTSGVVGEALAPILTMETEWDQAKLEKRWGDITVAGFFGGTDASTEPEWLEIPGISEWISGISGILMIVRLNGVLFRLYFEYCDHAVAHLCSDWASGCWHIWVD